MKGLKRDKRGTIERLRPEAHIGLSQSQAEERGRAGWCNETEDGLSKTEGQIIWDNVVTFFNLLFFLLALCLFAVGAYADMLFFVIVIVNTLIGIVQELRVKRTLDKITLLAGRDVMVVRDGKQTALPPGELVLDDVVQLGPGSQICADAIVCCGNVEVNEALLTGETDVIVKGEGDMLLSGSFITAGRCFARLERVGGDSYAAEITGEAKRRKKYRSEMMRSLDGLLKWIGVGIIPVGLIMFAKQSQLPDTGLVYAVSSTVAAMVGMIPEGLYLLVSIALTLSVVKLAKSNTLVHELSCIENLARVDILCLDKTGTITEGSMEVVKTIPLFGCSEEELKQLLGSYVHSDGSDNTTAKALKEAFPRVERWEAVKEVPFSSERKWGALQIDNGHSYILGAPEMILKEGVSQYKKTIGAYLAAGQRVLLLAGGEVKISPPVIKDAQPLGFVVMEDKLRGNARETLRYFREQGVTIKVISGDNAESVAVVASRAGVENAERYVDMEVFERTEGSGGDEMGAIAEDNAVFGRVSPRQKKELIQEMKKAGHTVAMIGDGVNDVLALKEADCSIAMAAGSDAAQHVSQMVLLNSDFSSMLQIVKEGRRVINNIQRSASLFLVKNLYSFFITMVLLFAAAPYPFVPIQLTLISGLLIGVPSFLLTLEPSYERIQGKFLRNILLNALPGGLVNAFSVLTILWIGVSVGMPVGEISSICTLTAGVNGLLILLFLCWPLSSARLWLVTAMGAGFFGAASLLPELFRIEPLSVEGWSILLAFSAAGPLLMGAAVFGVSHLKRRVAAADLKEGRRGEKPD